MNDSKLDGKNYEKISEFTTSLRSLLQEVMFLQMGSVRDNGLTVPKFFLLKFLNYHGERKTSDISQLLGISLPTVSEILNSIESDRLIERVHDEKDRRVVMVRLTDQGRAFVKNIESRNQTLIERSLSRMPDHDLDAMLDFLRELTVLIHNSVEKKIQRQGDQDGN
ncbi:MAG: MarR family winged helix-turn-helix transcriptional regulator [Thermoplasmataceae archaeon]